MSKRRKTTTAEVIVEGEALIVRYRQGARETRSTSGELVDALSQLTHQHRALVVDCDRLEAQTPDAREQMARFCRRHQIGRVAVVVHSAVSQVLGSAYLGIQIIPGVELKTFTAEPAALAWIAQRKTTERGIPRIDTKP